MITWQLPLQHQQPITEQREVRSWKKLDREKFHDAILHSELSDALQSECATEIFKTYQRVLQSLADTFVPVRQMKVRRKPIAIWMNTECHQLRRHSRMLQRRYQRTNSPADRQAWVEHECKRHHTYRGKESIYWNHRLADNSKQPSKL